MKYLMKLNLFSNINGFVYVIFVNIDQLKGRSMLSRITNALVVINT